MGGRAGKAALREGRKPRLGDQTTLAPAEVPALDWASDLGYEVARGNIANILKEHGPEPAPERTRKTTWKEFLRRHWEVMVAADFFTVEVWTRTRLTRSLLIQWRYTGWGVRLPASPGTAQQKGEALNETAQFELWYERFNRLAGDLYPGRYSRDHVRDLAEMGREIMELARRKGSLIVAHNYVYPELQEVAEVVGDSLGLSLFVASRNAPRVDFCGVWFMGQTAKIILGDRSKVYMPDQPGCSLVDLVDHRRITDWITRHQDGVVISYVNTDARMKAMSHYTCTSANAAQVLEHAARTHPGRRILFLPDKYLGAVAQALARVNPNLVDLYDGACHVHARIGKEVAEKALARQPGAELLIHPECACSALITSNLPPFKDAHFLSSEQMLRYAATSAAKEFVVATEKGIVYRLRKECPGKTFYPISDNAVCEYMKMNTLEKLRDSLRHDRFEVEVDQAVRDKAREAVERMLTIH